MTGSIPAPEPRLHLQLLDGFRLGFGRTPIHVVPGAQRLLALLALHPSPVPRPVAAALLWPEATSRRAAACLRSSLWRLSKPAPLVAFVEDALTLDVEVDIDFRRACALTAEPGADSDAVALLKADLLPGWDQPWVQAERDWWRQARLRALEVLSERLRSRGDHHHAHQAALAAVQTDPLRESAHRTLVQLHLADGNPAQALRQYQIYRALLRSELGLEPSPYIHDLMRPLLRSARR
ncbi:AfsR/SARP family transcriptional regulator [Lentzea californiensis]|uniref:AfsR/SARP family transcriptional regulator n=1 Tax=Lentzea californiensis TaxID=438851 RepID=UPI0021669D36|nr:bacterial transcriptional activator domain-containing protein [Lentzea californiensis]MCR3750767.1 DNA-binding transcriptional activator of the SARP family [Lentzea californiensis]